MPPRGIRYPPALVYGYVADPELRDELLASNLSCGNIRKAWTTKNSVTPHARRAVSSLDSEWVIA
jgi:hypothetical protein